eukprot:GEMP01040291.1.p1 GENE.GEMP01040291.1~~GEMP01040291.1.p1  ORF type:complete len:314 (+),score=68.76 GEMP01040291.1:55-942(+)
MKQRGTVPATILNLDSFQNPANAAPSSDHHCGVRPHASSATLKSGQYEAVRASMPNLSPACNSYSSEPNQLMFAEGLTQTSSSSLKGEGPDGIGKIREVRNIPSYFPAFLSAQNLNDLHIEEPVVDSSAASDVAYWKKNAIHKGEVNKALLRTKNEGEARIASLETQIRELNNYCWQLQGEVKYQQQQSNQAMAAPRHIAMEIDSLRDQLDAACQIRDTLFQENIALQAKLDEQSKKCCEEASVGTCVVCCDNLADVVILPCKHLCVCNDCSELGHKCCPICRGTLEDLLRIYAA